MTLIHLLKKGEYGLAAVCNVSLSDAYRSMIELTVVFLRGVCRVAELLQLLSLSVFEMRSYLFNA